METADLSHHISRRFNEDLERVRTRVLTMGGLVEELLAKAITALIEGDSSLGESVAARRPRRSTAWKWPSTRSAAASSPRARRPPATCA